MKVNLGGEEMKLYCDTGSNITIITPEMYKESMGKVVAARRYLRAWGSTDFLDTKGMFKTTLTTASGATKRTWVYVVAGARPELLLGDHEAEELGIVSFNPEGRAREEEKGDESHEDVNKVSNPAMLRQAGKRDNTERPPLHEVETKGKEETNGIVSRFKRPAFTDREGRTEVEQEGIRYKEGPKPEQPARFAFNPGRQATSYDAEPGHNHKEDRSYKEGTDPHGKLRTRDGVFRWDEESDASHQTNRGDPQQDGHGTGDKNNAKTDSSDSEAGNNLGKAENSGGNCKTETNLMHGETHQDGRSDSKAETSGDPRAGTNGISDSKAETNLKHDETHQDGQSHQERLKMKRLFYGNPGNRTGGWTGHSPAKDLTEVDASIKTLTGMLAKDHAEVDASTRTPTRMHIKTFTGMLTKDLTEVDASIKTLTGMLAKDLAEVDANINILTGMRGKDTRIANSRSKNLAKTDASIKDHTGMHAKGHVEENASTKTLTGSKSKEGIGTDEPRFGGPKEPRYGRLAVNTRLANSRSKNLAKDLAEEDASTKTLTVRPAKDLTGMHAKDLAEGSVSIKTSPGAGARKGSALTTASRPPPGYSAATPRARPAARPAATPAAAPAAGVAINSC